MPMVGGDNGDAMLQMAFQMIRGAQERRARQGETLIKTALPGQTAGQVGMDKKVYAETFGKDTPYDPNRVLRLQTSRDVVDAAVRDHMLSLNPDQKANMVATYDLNQSGVAGPTTAKGYEALQSSAETRAITGRATAEQTQTMVNKAIESMNKWDTTNQVAFGERAGFGTTQGEVEADRLKNQLGNASLNEAIKAIADPNHPLHAFLKQNDLDMPTVMAGMSMGLGSLFNNWTQMKMTSKDTTDQFKLAEYKMQLGVAEKMSMDVFHGKLSPKQVMAVINYKENGGPKPAGMDGAIALYDSAVSANYNAAILDALEKGDPLIQSQKTQIDLQTRPGADPHAVEVSRDLSAQIAARAMTLKQFGGAEPTDPQGRALWNSMYQKNLERVPKGQVYYPWRFNAPGQNMTGPTNPPPMAPTNAPVGPTGTPGQPVQPIQPVGNVPAASSILKDQTTNQPPTPQVQVSPEDQKAILEFMQAYGIGQQQQQAPGQPPQ